MDLIKELLSNRAHPERDQLVDPIKYAWLSLNKTPFPPALGYTHGSRGKNGIETRERCDLFFKGPRGRECEGNLRIFAAQSSYGTDPSEYEEVHRDVSRESSYSQ